jgi:hypothetical protein
MLFSLLEIIMDIFAWGWFAYGITVVVLCADLLSTIGAMDILVET